MADRPAYNGDHGGHWVSHSLQELWGLSDFKSIGHAAACYSGMHVNVLTGANSIGKSSFLQSLLMFCQSVNSGSGILLNGPLVSLGYPSDVIRNGRESCCVSIDFQNLQHTDLNRPKHTVFPFRADITLCPTRLSGGPAREGSLEIERIEFVSNDTCVFTLERANPSSNDYLDCMQCFDEDTENGGEWFHLAVMKVVPAGRRTLSRTYVEFRGFEPVSLIKYRSEDEAFRAYRSELLNFLKGRPFSSVSGYKLRRIVDAFYDRGIDIGSWREARTSAIDEFAKLGEEDKRNLVDAIARSISRVNPKLIWDIAPRIEPNIASDDLEMGLRASSQRNQLEELFLLLIDYGVTIKQLASHVEYIGPLRDDPRVVSPLSEVDSANLPVGMKGELAASKLLLKQGTSGTYGLPNSNAPAKHKFEEVLDAWARYLGIADTIRATNLPKFGVAFSVTSTSLSEGDLTTVGVGASQVIPILIGVLCVPYGSTVLIEQPELHLHPSAQAKLADFFLFARPDLTFLVESHSEALVTRLRRRVVEDEALASRISILFFEHDGYGACVEARSLSIGEYGNLEEWPRGFMDAVQEDSRAILHASIEKRRRLRSSNG